MNIIHEQQTAEMNLLITSLRAHTQSTQMAIVARSMFGLFFVLTALVTARF